MTDPKARQDLVPEPTPPERAIEGADAAIADVDVTQIITARSIADAPAAYLPALAYERRVVAWDALWSDAVKRAVLEAAPEVHRHCGTPYAVKTALAALNVDATLTEWWQLAPQGVPYTFHVTAYARGRLYDGPLLNARLQRIIFATVMGTKPESRAFDLTVAAKLPATLGLAPVAVARSRTAVAMVPRNARDLQATLGVAPVAVARSRTAVALAPRHGRDLAATIGLAAAAVARVRVAVGFNFKAAP